MSHDIEIIGDGCAALSFAARAKELENCSVTLIRPRNAPGDADHVWGFWADEVLRPAEKLARGTWQKWAIVTNEQRTILESTKNPYNAIKRSDWKQYCLSQSSSANVKIIEEAQWENNLHSQVYDTRPPVPVEHNLLQHFHGIEIKTETPVFDPDVALLMDFRVDQSKGMHFIYLLPYSSTDALIESTIFSTNVEKEEFYLNNINAYLESYYDIKEYAITHQEKGVIPLGKLAPHDANIPGLGANGGAIRPASGYAFLFIQRQINSAIMRYKNDKNIQFKNPHKRLDLWMDSVLLTVLRHWPEQGPNLFVRMGKALTGDQFVKFMTGDAGWWIKMKVILSMPKIPFIKALTKRILRRDKRTTPAVV